LFAASPGEFGEGRGNLDAVMGPAPPAYMRKGSTSRRPASPRRTLPAQLMRLASCRNYTTSIMQELYKRCWGIARGGGAGCQRPVAARDHIIVKSCADDRAQAPAEWGRPECNETEQAKAILPLPVREPQNAKDAGQWQAVMTCLE